jgi:hypothetical protein
MTARGRRSCTSRRRLVDLLPSEGDIREYVKRRKVSGGTRSDEGRRGRDTFASLKKTCRKLAISFWSYLNDRLRGEKRIPPLPRLIDAHARAP